MLERRAPASPSGEQPDRLSKGCVTAMKIGIVLEGGGMRGLYTVGVLDALMERQVQPDYIIGVSAGAGNGVSFVSGQKGRGYRVCVNYLRDKRYISLSNFIRTKSVFGMDFVFNDIPEKYDPFNYEAFLANPCEFVTGVTNVVTGKPEYYGKQPTMAEQCRLLRASSAIPMFSPIVEFHGHKYLDGGTSAPIPVRKALADGCDRVVVVLTQHREYQKPPTGHASLYSRAFREYPAMIDLLAHRHELYNETRQYAWELEKEGRAFVVAPSSPLSVGRFERRRKALDAVHQMGKRDILLSWDRLSAFLRGE